MTDDISIRDLEKDFSGFKAVNKLSLERKTRGNLRIIRSKRSRKDDSY